MKVRTLILTVGAVLALTAAATASASTQTNVFRSPSTNIGCRYYSSIQTVACQTENDNYAIAVSRFGGKSFPWAHDWIAPNAIQLAYGGKWTAPGILCTSRRTGMECRTSAGHGFILAANGVARW